MNRMGDSLTNYLRTIAADATVYTLFQTTKCFFNQKSLHDYKNLFIINIVQ